MGRLKTVSMAPRPGKRPLASKNPSALPVMATTIVASKAACRETDRGLQTHGGMPSVFSHERGTSPVTRARRSPVRPAAPRCFPDARRRAPPRHSAMLVSDHDVTELLRLFGVVGHEHSRDARGDDHPPDELSQVAADGGVEGGEGLVEQYQGRLPGQPSGQRHSLTLAAREGAGPAVGQCLGSDPLEPTAADGASCPAAAGLADGEGDVVKGRAVRQEQPVLEDHADAALLRGDVGTAGAVRYHLTVYGDGALIRADQAGDEREGQ